MTKINKLGVFTHCAFALSVLAGATTTALAQDPFAGMKQLFTIPNSYVVTYTPQAPKIDGSLDDDAWEKASWTTDFQDIEGALKSKPYHATHAKMLWDDKYLYIAAELEEPHVWANLTQHDAIVYNDNDFEVFIDPDGDTHQYYEIEINALNTIFDLFMPKPYRNGSDALISWDTPGLIHAVKVNGTLNKHTDIDKGWTVEMAIPFSALSMGVNANVPKEGAIWRINFSRVQWETDIAEGDKTVDYVKRKDRKGKPLPENNWVWSPQGVVDMHRPERWGYIQFTRNLAGENVPAFELPFCELQKQYLWLVYYKQKEYLSKHKRYASSLKELKMTPSCIINNTTQNLDMEVTDHQFIVSIKSENDNRVYTVNDEGLVH